MSTIVQAPDPFALQFIETYRLYRVAVYSNLFNGIVYGAYIVAYVTSVYVLLSKPGFTSSPFRMCMLGTTTFMFSLGIVALVLEITIEFLSANPSIPFSTFDAVINDYYYAWATITCLMYILGDTICAWRTVVVWNNDKCIITILVLFILGTTVAAGWSLSFGLIQSAYPGDRSVVAKKLDLILVCPTLATNLLSTGLIAWKAWKRRIPVGKHLRKGRGRYRVDRVFALLIDSGLIYCCIWILYLISKYTVLPDPSFTGVAFVSGLYPTLIIILVSKQMSPGALYLTDSTDSTEMHFTGTHHRG